MTPNVLAAALVAAVLHVLASIVWAAVIVVVVGVLIGAWMERRRR